MSIRRKNIVLVTEKYCTFCGYLKIKVTVNLNDVAT